MNRESLILASNKIMELLSIIEKMDDVDRVELMLNIDKFLDPNEYDNNVKQMRLVYSRRRYVDETYKYTE